MSSVEQTEDALSIVTLAFTSQGGKIDQELQTIGGKKRLIFLSKALHLLLFPTFDLLISTSG